jgi:asparagine N-glycosylation enzyme membrane subunit Stt3
MTKNDFLKMTRRYFLKNKFVLVFNVLAALSIILALFQHFNIGRSITFFSQVIYLFPNSLWIFLSLILIISGILAFYEKYNLMFIPIIFWLLFTTATIRTSNMPLLKNAATGDWELGPDLDPYLFLRIAKEIVAGDFESHDVMRGAPLGIPSYGLRSIMPQAIVFVYNFINFFGDYSVTYAAIISPVIFFVLSVIGFFFFVYFLFSFKFSKEKSLVGATVASFLYSFVPSMLHRTAAGIPELESLGMVWFWLAFLFFILAWKTETRKKIVLFGLLSGLFTGTMSWTWGGYRYIILVITLSSFLSFLFDKERKKNLMIFVSWFVVAVALEILRFGTPRILADAQGFGFSFIVLIMIFLREFLDFNLMKNRFKKMKLPKPILSILILLCLGVIGILMINPSRLVELPLKFIDTFLTPFGGGRLGVTVAENRVPYFLEALGNFGNLIYLFLLGAIVFFYGAVKHFKLKNKIILNSGFIIFLLFFVFSSSSPNHLLNGQNLISRALYLLAPIILFSTLLYVYIKAFVKKDEKTLEDFKQIEICYFVLLAFLFFGIMFMRTAVRFFFLIAPTIIFIGCYFIIKLTDYFKSRDSTGRKIIIGIFLISILILSGVAINYAYVTSVSARQIAPSVYNQQWHYAMNWVKENTPKEAIFAHWWDYGYWVQTIGERATLTDGGHPNFWFTYSSARYVLTSPTPDTALSMFKSIGIDYFLIDSTDLAKYGAFSSIGSDETGTDRRSWIPVMPADERQTQETANGTVKIYAGGTGTDKDIIYEGDGKRIFLPEGRTGLGGIILQYSQGGNEISFSQPRGAYFYNNQRYDLPIRYLYYDGKVLDFGSGINATLRIIPAVVQTAQGIQVDSLGAVIYLSEKTMNSFLAEMYLMNDPYNNYPTLKVAHVQHDFVVESLKQQGLNLGEFLYYQGFRGPIKIWDVRNIPEEILIREEFLKSEEEMNRLYPLEKWWGLLDNLEFKK